MVAIKVDQYGNVTEATPGADGTTTTNNSVWNAAKSAAMRAHFNIKADAPALQEGTITYTFVSSGLAETDESALKFMDIPVQSLLVTVSCRFCLGGLRNRSFWFFPQKVR